MWKFTTKKTPIITPSNLVSRLWLCNLCYHTILFNGFISLGVMVSFVTFNEFVEAFLVALILAPCCWGTNEIWSLSIPLLYQNFSLSKFGMNAKSFKQQKVDILHIGMNGITCFYLTHACFYLTCVLSAKAYCQRKNHIPLQCEDSCYNQQFCQRK
jgi:hypothetical protein